MVKRYPVKDVKGTAKIILKIKPATVVEGNINKKDAKP